MRSTRIAPICRYGKTIIHPTHVHLQSESIFLAKKKIIVQLSSQCNRHGRRLPISFHRKAQSDPERGSRWQSPALKIKCVTQQVSHFALCVFFKFLSYFLRGKHQVDTHGGQLFGQISQHRILQCLLDRPHRKNRRMTEGIRDPLACPLLKG